MKHSFVVVFWLMPVLLFQTVDSIQNWCGMIISPWQLLDCSLPDRRTADIKVLDQGSQHNINKQYLAGLTYSWQ